MNKTTPKGYLSYSQMSCLKYSEKQYIDRYIWNIKQEETDFLKLGKKLAKALQFREEKSDEDIERIKKQIPDYPKREFELTANLKGIPLLCYFDGFDEKNLKLRDDKTGQKKSLARWREQMLFYSVAIWLKYKKLPKEIKVYWIRTKFNDDGQLVFSGDPVKMYDIKITLKDIIIFAAEINKTWKRIKEIYQEQKMMF